MPRTSHVTQAAALGLVVLAGCLVGQAPIKRSNFFLLPDPYPQWIEEVRQELKLETREEAVAYTLRLLEESVDRDLAESPDWFSPEIEKELQMEAKRQREQHGSQCPNREP